MAPPQSFRELMERYQKGERDFRGAELDVDQDNDLKGKCLAGADFSDAFVVADFRRADLQGVRFINANVKTCDFSYADLTDAEFSGAALESTSFVGAKLKGARFVGSHNHGKVLGPDELPNW